ncbi:MAG: 2OG-Fe(II) oxygenase [Gammaproteobacteria bacterium]
MSSSITTNAACASEPHYDAIVDAIAEQGFWTGREAFPKDLAFALHSEAAADKKYTPAGIGRAGAHRLDSTTRGDGIRWIEAPGSTAEADFLSWMEGLRQCVNRALYLGLFDYEAHFARYQPGAFYKRHLDAFTGQTNRRLSTVLYLNPDWSDDDGGELLLYRDPQATQPILSVSPHIGTLVVFLSTDFPHEVLAAQRARHSIAGWFRVNGGP